MEHQSLIAHFYAWQQDLTWHRAVLFLLFVVVFACVLAAAARLAVLQYTAWHERRAVRARNWRLKQERAQLIVDAQREREAREAEEDEAIRRRTAMRVWRDRVQHNRESKQFHLPSAFRDVKGVHRL